MIHPESLQASLFWHYFSYVSSMICLMGFHSKLNSMLMMYNLTLPFTQNSRDCQNYHTDIWTHQWAEEWKMAFNYCKFLRITNRKHPTVLYDSMTLTQLFQNILVVLVLYVAIAVCLCICTLALKKPMHNLVHAHNSA